MADVLLISADYLKRYTKLNEGVEDTYIYPSVTLAQEKHLQSYLGTALYEKIINDTASGSISGNYLTLRNDYIRRAVAWWTMVELIPDMYVKVDNGGLMIRVSEDTTTITQDDLRNEQDRARSNAMYYTDRMRRYICTNSELFPEYSEIEEGDIPAQKDVFPTFEISRRNA